MKILKPLFLFLFLLLGFFSSSAFALSCVGASAGSYGSANSACAAIGPAFYAGPSLSSASGTSQGACYNTGNPASPSSAGWSCSGAPTSCPAGQMFDNFKTSCVPAYVGSHALQICDANGVCTGNIFPDANSACQSYGTGPIGNGAGAHIDKLTGNSCASTQCFSNGSCTTTTYDLTSGLPVGSPSTTPPPTPASGVPTTTPTTTPSSGVPTTMPTSSPSSGVPGSAPGGGTSPAAGGGGGTGTGTGTGTPTTPSTCVPTPSVPCSGSGTALLGSPFPADPAGSWYTKIYPNGLKGVLTDNFTTMQQTPLAKLINNIVPTFSGAPSTGCFSLSVWHAGTQLLCIPPMVMTLLGIIMILTALFSARAIIFGG